MQVLLYSGFSLAFDDWRPLILITGFLAFCTHLFPSQACHLEGGSAGLIPSQLLEEKRKAFVKRDLELATTGTPFSRAEGAPLIMQI